MTSTLQSSKSLLRASPASSCVRVRCVLLREVCLSSLCCSPHPSIDQYMPAYDTILQLAYSTPLKPLRPLTSRSITQHRAASRSITHHYTTLQLNLLIIVNRLYEGGQLQRTCHTNTLCCPCNYLLRLHLACCLALSS